LESIFGFCGVSTLGAVMAVSRSWQAAVLSMAPVRGRLKGLGLDWCLWVHPLEACMVSRLRRHVVGLQTEHPFEIRDESASALRDLLARMPWLETLHCAIGLPDLGQATLDALGLAAPDGHGGVGVAADALAALAADAQGFLGTRLRAALDGGTLLGMTGSPGGPWNLPAAALPLNLGLTTSPAGVHISTPGAGLDLGGIRLSSDFRISLPDFAPQISATLAAGPVTLTFTQPGGHLVLDAPPWVSALSLLPAGSGAAQQAAALSLIPRLALSSAVSAVIESLVGPALRIGPIDALLAGPGARVQAYVHALGLG